MQFKDSANPTEPELRAWAAQAGADWPDQDWEVALARGIERKRLRLMAELADDESLPNARFFLLVLYTWVECHALDEAYGSWHAQFDRWLYETRGVRRPALKRWRHRARLVFQGVERFDAHSWWSRFETDQTAA